MLPPCVIPTTSLTLAQRVALVAKQVAQLRQAFAYLRRQSQLNPTDLTRWVAESTQHSDEAFRLMGVIDGLLKELESTARHPSNAALRRILRNARRRAVRDNRRHIAHLQPTAISLAPASYFRNFLRDATERMYFLALHDLPSAFDLFCCTYVETPAEYIQEIHLHRYTEELTLVLEGISDCVWYEESRAGDLREAGRITASRLEAFRIPVGVPHSIDSRHGPNRNLTVKLSMCIEDRVGEREWGFRRARKSRQPVTIEAGLSHRIPAGRRRVYSHRHQSLAFQYVVDELTTDSLTKASSPFCGSQASLAAGHYFLFEGEASFWPARPIPTRTASSASKYTLGDEASRQGDACDSLELIAPGVLRVAPARTTFVNKVRGPASLFHVQGLDPFHLLSDDDTTRLFPRWLIDELTRERACLTRMGDRLG